jgi:enoyl-CoA hydratase/carnithine racemase
MSEREFVKTTIDNRIATLTIDHPPANAFNGQTMRELRAAFSDVLADRAVKAIIITGAGTRFFVAGADIKEMAQASSEGKARDLIANGQATFSLIEASRKPVIAAVNGFCLGGGMELFLACHMRLAVPAARFGQPEINLGIIPGWGGTQRLTRQIGTARALELILTGDPIDADQAMQLGLLNKIVAAENLLDEAKTLAGKIAAKGGLAVTAAVKAVYEGLRLPPDEGLRLEMEEMLTLLTTHDAYEGFTAFAAKRAPQFTDS